MAHRQVVFHPLADEEVEEARGWYEERSPSAAEGFLDEVDYAIEQVQNGPEHWPRYLARTRRFVCSRYPYSLIYTFQGNVIRILAVAHEKRREGYWVGRR